MQGSIVSLVQVPMPMTVSVPQPTPRAQPQLQAHPPVVPSLKEVNDFPSTRRVLTQALSELSERLHRSFCRQVRLVVHGGAVMALHPSFSHRESTQDVDYIHRSFVPEYKALGVPDAEQRLRTCIAETAHKFGLGADWMNDHADVALPWALDQQGLKYDPIYYASTQHQNAVPQTIFSERGLALVAVPWPWAIALKLVRYAKQDPTNCAAVLRLGVAQRGIRWTRAVDHGALLADRLYRVSAPAEAAAPSAHTGRPLSRVPTWIARHTRGADDERDLLYFS